MSKHRKKIATLGGGTGSFTLLSGLKQYPYDITAIVSMADDGGSTGVLREELGVLPPGDIRQCLVALADRGETLREVMNHRFQKGSLAGHSVGNILISAFEEVTGDFVRGVEKMSEVLSLRGRVLPISTQKMTLLIELLSGKILEGEHHLDESQEVREVGVKRVSLKEPVDIAPQAAKALSEADAILIGPGDFYGSILPHLLVRGIKEVFSHTNAEIILVANLTNRKGQTSFWDVDRYVEEIEQFLGKGTITAVLFNTQNPPKELFRRYYEKEGEGFLVRAQEPQRIPSYRLLKAPLLSLKEVQKTPGDTLASSRSFLRHDSALLAQKLAEVIDAL